MTFENDRRYRIGDSRFQGFEPTAVQSPLPSDQHCSGVGHRKLRIKVSVDQLLLYLLAKGQGVSDGSDIRMKKYVRRSLRSAAHGDMEVPHIDPSPSFLFMSVAFY